MQSWKTVSLVLSFTITLCYAGNQTTIDTPTASVENVRKINEAIESNGVTEVISIKEAVANQINITSGDKANETEAKSITIDDETAVQNEPNPYNTFNQSEAVKVISRDTKKGNDEENKDQTNNDSLFKLNTTGIFHNEFNKSEAISDLDRTKSIEKIFTNQPAFQQHKSNEQKVNQYQSIDQASKINQQNIFHDADDDDVVANPDKSSYGVSKPLQSHNKENVGIAPNGIIINQKDNKNKLSKELDEDNKANGVKVIYRQQSTIRNNAKLLPDESGKVQNGKSRLDTIIKRRKHFLHKNKVQKPNFAKVVNQEIMRKLKKAINEDGNEQKVNQPKQFSRFSNNGMANGARSNKFEAFKKKLIEAIMNKTSALVIKLTKNRYPSHEEEARVLIIIKEKVLRKVSPLSERYALWADIITQGVNATFAKLRHSIKGFKGSIKVSENKVRKKEHAMKASGFAKPNNCEVLTQRACTKIVGLNLLPCDSGNKSITMEKLCNGIYDCDDGSDEVKCSDKGEGFLSYLRKFNNCFVCFFPLYTSSREGKLEIKPCANPSSQRGKSRLIPPGLGPRGGVRPIPSLGKRPMPLGGDMMGRNDDDDVFKLNLASLKYNNKITFLAINKLKQAEKIVEEAESSSFMDCFKYDEGYLLKKKNDLVKKTVARQISLIAHCIDSPLVKMSIGGQTRNRIILEQGSNQIAMVISSISLALDGAICTELINDDDYDNIVKRVDEREDTIAFIDDENHEEWSYRSCECSGKVCVIHPCHAHCKAVCSHKHSLGQMVCRSFSRDTSVSLDLICDGKIDCEDESDEKDCSEGNAYARFKGFSSFDQVGQWIQIKIHTKYYGPVRGKLFQLQNSVMQLQKLSASQGVDKKAIKSARNKAFELLSSIYVDMLTRVSTFNETEDVFVFLMAINVELIKALKYSHTGNERLVPSEDCDCRGTICVVPFCSAYCVRACSVQPSFTTLACKKQPEVKVDLNKICDGKKDCPSGDDEKLCDKDVCRKHHFMLLHRRLKQELSTSFGSGQNLLSEILKTWKRKAISIAKTAEAAVIANRDNFKMIVKTLLHDLVMAYSFTDEVKGDPQQLYTAFYNVSQQVIKLVHYCGSY